MAIKTKKDYIDSIGNLRPTVYVSGQKIENIVESPYLRTTINNLGLGYDWANDPRYEDLLTNWSTLINEKVSFWAHIRKDPDDLMQMVRAINHFSGKYLCTMCMSMGLAALWATTYDIDQAKGTEYHQRFKNFFIKLQREDLRFVLGVMDPKGDRQLPPSKQPDPDLFLRVVEERPDGIVVNGAKMHTTSAPAAHYFVASPSRVLGPDDKEYALAFACPTDTKGITFITRPAAGPLEQKDMENPISSQIGFVESLSVFDNVFIPWEKVFMCGEWDFTAGFINYFSSYVRLAKGTCVAARTEMLAGISAQAAEYNGVEKAAHIRNKITDMIMDAKIGYGCAVAAARLATVHPSGIAFPDILTSNAGLYNTRLKYIHHLGVMQEIAGGAITTMPVEADYKHPEIGPLVKKYMQGKVGTPVEERYRILQLIQDMTASRLTGYLIGSALCAGGTPETNRVEVFRNYNLSERKENAKVLAKIKPDPYWGGCL
jgi:4-hydroxybutyryl-CoA dehydratase/vinylacetyl-CoA-Delta-isomerase